MDDATSRQIKGLLEGILEAEGPAGLDRAEATIAQWVAELRERAAPASPKSAETLLLDPAHRDRFPDIIGNSESMLRVLGLLDRVSVSNVPVLIQGESGTGKELIAKAIHRRSKRKDKPYVAENCAAVPETLLESELFGYKKGAFTGADRDRKGLFEVANKGTLFLDEIGDMSLQMQKKLLRALQDGEIRPVGATSSLNVDVRVISASNKMLRQQVEKGNFREDLFYRLNTVTVELPPLRERGEDVAELARFFAGKVASEMGLEVPEIAPPALRAMTEYSWPGNVRELENEIRRCLALHEPDSPIRVDDLSDEIHRAVEES